MTRRMNGLAGLLDELMTQECYLKYKQCLKEIKKEESLYLKLNEFRKKNVELHAKKGTLKEEAYLLEGYQKLLMNEKIQEFLKWEQQTLEMLRKIHDSIDGALELDFTFL